MRIDPGATIGIIGGGQLGRMLAVAASRLGYRCHVLAPDAAPPAADVAAEFTQARYDDADALARFGEAVDVATYEFENLPAASLARLGEKLVPGADSLKIAQDRAIEKAFIEANGGTVARWCRIDSEADCQAAEDALGLPLVLKSRRLGYDGKGQAWAREHGTAVAAWDAIGRQPAVAEAAVGFDAEFSVIIARDRDGKTACWDIPENRHQNGILKSSSVPAPDGIERLVPQAVAVAERLAEALGHVGVLTVEFFATADGPIVNEIAPRVHNSGHWTIEGAETSQFEQHIRAICGLPLGATARTAPAVTMENLLGDEVNLWPELVAEPGAHLHLYGKRVARQGRKMGHVTRLKH